MARGSYPWDRFPGSVRERTVLLALLKEYFGWDADSLRPEDSLAVLAWDPSSGMRDVEFFLRLRDILGLPPDAVSNLPAMRLGDTLTLLARIAGASDDDHDGGP
jgi:hypothetical protein